MKIDENDVFEEMVRQFDYIKDDLKGLTEAQDKLCKIIDENFKIDISKEISKKEK